MIGTNLELLRGFTLFGTTYQATYAHSAIQYGMELNVVPFLLSAVGHDEIRTYSILNIKPYHGQWEDR
jgi:hypothetical protein